MLSEILNLKIGDLTDRILDEIISDLTPYGYRELEPTSIEAYAIGVDELDNKKKYARTSMMSTPVPMSMNDTASDNGEIIYSHDVLAGIVLNGDKPTSARIVAEVDDKIGKSIMSEFYLKERKLKRRALLLSRKTIVRASKKIAKAIVENIVDMSVKKDDVGNFIKSIRGRLD